MPRKRHLKKSTVPADTTLLGGMVMVPQVGELEPFFANASEPKKLPNRLRVCPWGTTPTHNRGDVIVNEKTLSVLMANQEAKKFDRVAFDFGHNTLPRRDANGKVIPLKEPIEVAGYGTVEIVDGEGIFLTDIEYTPQGLATLPQGHYPDISPGVVRNDKGEVVFVHSVGAVRNGELDGLTLFSADSIDALLDDLAAFGVNDLDEESDKIDLRESLVDVLNALGAKPTLSGDASDEVIAVAAVDLLAAMKQAKTKTEDNDDTPPIDAMEAEEETNFEKRLTALEAETNGLKTDTAKTRRESIVAQATREGKKIPLTDEQIEGFDCDLLESMVDQLEATVPIESGLHGAVDDFAAKSSGHTTEDKHVAKLMGVELAGWFFQSLKTELLNLSYYGSSN